MGLALMNNRIKIKSQYQPSTSLQFDMTNREVLNGYIPTRSSLDVLEYIIRPTLMTGKGTFRSHLLTGAYGKGKSYSVLIALSLLGQKSNDGLQELLEKINTRREHLGVWINQLRSTDPILPVIVRGGYPSLSIAISSALVFALEREGIRNLSPVNNFDRAKEYLQMWEDKFPETFSSFITSIGGKEKYESFYSRLCLYEESALSEFVKVFPKLTSGSEFNRISDLNVIQDITDIADRISDHGFKGLYIIYDEFSKYLEGQRGIMSESDIRILQDLAELANSSSMSAQVHLLLISHKVPASYFSDDIAIHEWQAISGRFDQKDLFNFNDQEYEILQNILEIDPTYKTEFETMIEDYQDREFSLLKQNCIRRELFIEDQFKSVFYDCLPLHPITTYVLPRLSERIAQNERSLFTFIVSRDANSLTSFLQKNKEFQFLGLWDLFDYFRPLFRNASTDSPLFRIELMVSSIELKLRDMNALAVWAIKAIAILLILNDQKLRPNFEALTLCFSLVTDLEGKSISSSELSSAVKFVVDNGALCVSSSKDEYLPFAINVTLNNEINNSTKSKEKKINIFFDLEHNGFSHAAFPTEYNDEKCINRFFQYSYYDASYLHRVNELKTHHKNLTRYGDGVIYCYLDDPCKEETLQAFVREVSSWDLSIVLLPKMKIKSTLRRNIAQFSVLEEKLAKPLSSEDKMILQVLKQDTYEAIEKCLAPFINPDNNRVECYIGGVQQSWQTKRGFSSLCSREFWRVFNRTPRINREELNLNYLSKVSRNARDIVVQCILDGSIHKLEEYKETSQARTLFKSVEDIFGIMIENGDSTIVYEKDKLDDDILIPLDIITKYFLDASDCENSLTDLVSRLTSPAGHIGLKRGPLPLFFAVVCNRYIRRIIFRRRGREATLNPILLHNICEEPEEYTVMLKDWDRDKESYIQSLCSYFYVNDFGNNILDVLRDELIAWWEQLPLITRAIKGTLSLPECNINSFSSETIKLVKLIESFSGNPYTFFLEKIPYKFGRQNKLNRNFAKIIINSLQEISDAYEISMYVVKQFIVNRLTGNNSQQDWLIQLHAWADALPVYIEQNISAKCRLIIKSIQEPQNNSDKVFKIFCESLAGMRFSDWGESTVELFRHSLVDIKSEIEGVVNTPIQMKSERVELSFIDGLGKLGSIQIPTESSSEGLSGMVLNEIESIFNEFGDSLSKGERNRILFKLLME